MIEYGIWSEEADGFIDQGIYSKEAAFEATVDLVADGWSMEDDLTVREVCPEHEEQPADECEECWAEPEEDDTD